MRRISGFRHLIFLCDSVFDLVRLAFFSVFDRIALLGVRPVAPETPVTLVVRLDAIGDYLMFRPFLEPLVEHERRNGRRVRLCGNRVWRELAESFDGSLIDDFIWLDRGKFVRSPSYRWRKLRELNAIGYEQVISPTFSRDLFFADWVGGSVRARRKVACTGDPGTVGGWRKWLGDMTYTELLPVENRVLFEIERNRQFCQSLLGQAVATPARLLPEGGDVEHYGLPAAYAVLFVSASSKYRKWPLDRFRQVGSWLADECGLDVVVCGGPEDMAEVARDQVFSRDSRFHNLVGATTLLELIAIVGQARILVSNETMAPHCAALPNRTPCIVIYNGNNFGRALPYPEEICDRHFPVYHPAIAADPEAYKAESNRFGFYNTLDICDISTEMVIEQIKRAQPL